jgi:hypothetical protein
MRAVGSTCHALRPKEEEKEEEHEKKKAEDDGDGDEAAAAAEEEEEENTLAIQKLFTVVACWHEPISIHRVVVEL